MFHRRQHPHPRVFPTAVLCLEISAVNLREGVECSLQSAEIEPERGVKAPDAPGRCRLFGGVASECRCRVSCTGGSG